MWVGSSAMWEKVAGTHKEVALRRASKQSPARVCFSVWCLPATIIAEPGVEIAEEDESCEGMPASCHSSGEAAVGVDLSVVHVTVRLVEVEARGDRPARGGRFGNVVGKMLAHQPAVVRGVTRYLPPMAAMVAQPQW